MIFINNLIIFFPVLLIIHCFFLFFFKKWIGPIGSFYSTIIILVFSIIFAFYEFILLLSSGSYFFIDFGRWFYCLDLIDSHFVFCFDLLSITCSLLVLVLTTLALYFGVEYMYRDAFINRLLYLLFMFATSVIFLFFCFDFFLIILAWESIGLFSLLLVNFYSMRIYTIKASLKTFIFSRISDLFMFISFILVISWFNTTDLSLIFLQIPFLSFHYLFIGNLALHFLTVFSICIATSGVIKAAQFFSHVWLPDAMEAPTPASALIHSSTLVIAGVFLIIRFAILFEFVIFTNYYLAILGATTLAFASIAATYQTDIKKLVAYSTISQIGYLVCGCGFCCYEEVLIYLIIHALNKAFLFILVGYLVHFFNHNTDMRQMGGIYIYSYDLVILLLGVSINLAGLPYTAGFFGKEFLLFQILRDDFLSFFVRGCWLISFIFTPIYLFMLLFIVIFSTKKGTLPTYFSFWTINHKELFFILNKLLFKSINYKKFNFYLLYRFQWVLLNSRTTIYILFFFWILLFFFGDFLLLCIFNYSTLNSFIPNSFFYTIKYHTLFGLNSINFKLTSVIMFYIIFFTIVAIIFLINKNYKSNFFYIQTLYIWDFFIILLIIFLFTNWFFFIIFLFILSNFLYFVYNK